MSKPEDLSVVALFNEYVQQVHSVIVEEEDEGPDWEFTKLISTEFQLQSALAKLLDEVKEVRAIHRVSDALQKLLANDAEILAILKNAPTWGEPGWEGFVPE